MSAGGVRKTWQRLRKCADWARQNAAIRGAEKLCTPLSLTQSYADLCRLQDRKNLCTRDGRRPHNSRLPIERPRPMPNNCNSNAVRLEFTPGSLVQTYLWGAAFTDDWLWVAGDEACGIDRMRRPNPIGKETLRFGGVQDFPLADLLDLRGEDEEEAALEGMGEADGLGVRDLLQHD